MRIEKLNDVIARHIKALLRKDWEKALGYFDPEDNNYWVMAQFFNAFATKFDIKGADFKVERVRWRAPKDVGVAVFQLDLYSRTYATARTRVCYEFEDGDEGRVRRGTFSYRTGAEEAGAEPLIADTEPSGRALSGWFDAELAQLSAAASDPASSLEYGRAGGARLRYLDVNPRLDRAIILANMMSERVARIARAVRDPSPRKLLSNLYRYHLGAIEHLENHPDPVESYVSFINATYPVFDDATAYRGRDGKAYLVCGGQALFTTAVLHLCGVPANELIHGGLKSEFTIHEMAFWNSSEGPFLCSNAYFEPWGAKHFDDMSLVYRVSNSNWHADARGASTFTQDGLHRMRELFASHFSHFDVGFLDDIDTQEEHEPFPIIDADAAAVKKLVWQRAATRPTSAECFAKYATRSLLVHRPEAYLEYDMTSKVVREHASRDASADEIARDMAARPKKDSIYWERDRVMQAEHVLRFEVGDRLDLNHCLAALLLARGQRCALVIGHDDVAVAIKSSDGWRTLRADAPDDHRTVADPLLVVNERSAIAPRLGRESSRDEELQSLVPLAPASPASSASRG